MNFNVVKEFFMSFLQKKTVIIVAAFLLVIGVGMAFAATDGISLKWLDNTVQVTNSNNRSYHVTVQITYSANGYRHQTTQRVIVKARETRSVPIGTSAIIEHAEVTEAEPGF
jgi:hypothetical protein